MSRHDSQPPHPDWEPESRPCPCFDRPGYRITTTDGTELLIPPSIVLGEN